MATAFIKTKSKTGEIHFLRALIDPGSQSSIIKEEVVQLLNLPKFKISAQISGIGETDAGKVQLGVSVEIQPRFASTYKTTVNAIVMKKLTGILPEEKLYDTKFNNLVLADPKYMEPGKVDIMLGAEIYARILENGIVKGEPTAQKTSLGWIIFGELPNKKSKNIISLVSKIKLDEQLQKFWEQEEPIKRSKTATLSPEDQYCEQLYANTVKKESDGRYVVKVPFKEEKLIELGESKQKAFAMLRSMERKFIKNPTLKADYTKFMTEYQALGHMKKIQNTEQVKYYIPHHSVIKSDSTTTKLRVVFNASAKTSTNISLNDCMYTGPKIQNDIYTVLLKWRMYPIAITADIEKMYRQILITDTDQMYHAILWRESPNMQPETFLLSTVSYGTAAAPFLAIRTLHQAALEEPDKSIATKIREDFYVDDFMSGAFSEAEAKTLVKKIQKSLLKSQLHLRKWISNKPEVLGSLAQEDIDQRSIEIDSEQSIKSLGLHWNPRTDKVTFKVQLNDIQKYTKRELVSKIAQLYDPVEWLSPVIIKGKLLLQKCWKVQCDWDDLLPIEITEEWVKFHEQLPTLEKLNIPRWIGYGKSSKLQIHGFCDSSMEAYGAAIYLRNENCDGTITTQLLTAKTRVPQTNQSLHCLNWN